MSVSKLSKYLFTGEHGRLESRENNFTAIRTAFALLVLGGHAIMLPMGLPIHGVFPEFLDGVVQFALDGFFILSGYMIAASVMRGNDMLNYALSRFLRILPGLIAAMLILWLLVGPTFTSLSLQDYFAHGETWLFPVLILSQADPQATLPGVFSGHPIPEMDGPLWTIRYELLAYLAAGVFAVAGIFRSRWGILAVFIGAALLSITELIWPYEGVGSGTVFAAARFGGAFMVGAAMYAWRDYIPLAPGWALMLAAWAFILRDLPSSMVAGQVAMAYATLWAGYVFIPGRTGQVVREVEDISYGIYILHWPIGQMALAMIPAIGSGQLFLIMLPLSVLAGWLLRVLVERPALAMKPALLAAIRGQQARPAR
ncbi:acyltransferase family protein [Hyphobacterium sp.]|uniref:acyltransferase family protein n=1 Tax=Hyphobacterium sp. TaxID=2004662 RepID=UPI003BA89A12